MSSPVRSPATTPSAPAPLLPGDPARIGRYRLVGRLGSGGMGTVFGAVEESGAKVAVKLIHRRHAADPNFRARFAEEVALLDRVESARTVTILDADTTSPQPWLATEYIPGPTLEEHVRDQGPLRGPTLVCLAAGVAEALRSLHTAGLAHRDLHPGNVILAPDGPKVLDFGIAQAVGETPTASTSPVVGTPGWIAPEQYRGAPPSPATDMFAWGGLVTYAATGRGPFGDGDASTLATRTLNDAPETTGVPDELLPLVTGALGKDPVTRPSANMTLTWITNRWPGHLPRPGTDPTALLANLLHHSWNGAFETPSQDASWTPPKRLRGPNRRLLITALAVVAALALVVSMTATVPTLREATWGQALAGGQRPDGETTPGSPPAAIPDAPAEDSAQEEEAAQLAAQDEIAHWRPFDPDAASREEFETVLGYGDPGAMAPPELDIATPPVDHATFDYVLSTDTIPTFPVVTMRLEAVRETADGVEFTATATFHPHVGSHTVHAEDFLVLVPEEPASSAVDGETFYGGAGEAWIQDPTEVVTLDPDSPVQEITVEITGAPDEGGVKYRPVAHEGYLVHDITGLCYSVPAATAEWRDRSHLGAEQFALSGSNPDQSTLTDCPA